jgi:hypothetical protein
MMGQTKPGSAGALAGLGNVDLRAANDIRINSNSSLRLQYLSKPLHALGPKPLFHFLEELERGADLRASLEEYAVLPVEFVAAFGGDQFQSSFRAANGGRL